MAFDDSGSHSEDAQKTSLTDHLAGCESPALEFSSPYSLYSATTRIEIADVNE